MRVRISMGWHEFWAWKGRGEETRALFGVVWAQKYMEIIGNYRETIGNHEKMLFSCFFDYMFVIY